MRIFLLIIFISLPVLAEPIPKAWQKGTHTSVNIKGHSYPLVHLERNAGIPILLLHGLGGNAHNWMELGSALYNAGFDVWAFTWSSNFSRDIEQSGKKTVKELVDYITGTTNKKLFIVGHSLGGVISKIYAFGIDRRFFTKEIYVNPRLKRHSIENVSGVVSINSPSGVDEKFQRLIPFLQRMPSKSGITHAELSEIIKSQKLERDLHIVRAFEFSTIGSRLPFIRNYTRIMFNSAYHDFSDLDLGKLLRYGTSPTSPLITSQISSTPEQIEEANILNSIFHTERKHVPFAYIAGEADDIAEDLIIQEEAAAQNSPYLLLPHAGHMDALSGELVPTTAYFLIKFFNMNSL